MSCRQSLTFLTGCWSNSLTILWKAMLVAEGQHLKTQGPNIIFIILNRLWLEGSVKWSGWGDYLRSLHGRKARSYPGVPNHILGRQCPWNAPCGGSHVFLDLWKYGVCPSFLPGSRPCFSVVLALQTPLARWLSGELQQPSRRLWHLSTHCRRLFVNDVQTTTMGGQVVKMLFPMRSTSRNNSRHSNEN